MRSKRLAYLQCRVPWRSSAGTSRAWTTRCGARHHREGSGDRRTQWRALLDSRTPSHQGRGGAPACCDRSDVGSRRLLLRCDRFGSRTGGPLLGIAGGAQPCPYADKTGSAGRRKTNSRFGVRQIHRGVRNHRSSVGEGPVGHLSAQNPRPQMVCSVGFARAARWKKASTAWPINFRTSPTTTTR